MSKASEKRESKENALSKLREWLAPGTTVYTILRHVSSSGTSRRISVVANVGDEVMDISGYVALALEYRRNHKDGALVVGGCGMDMGYHIVNNLSYALHGRDSVGDDAIEAGYAGRPFSPRADAYRAGYSLNHRWL